MERAVFLDRDGVLNRAFVSGGVPHPPTGLDDLEVLPGVPEALARLREQGFHLIVVTNQPDVARGVQQRAVVEAINAALAARLPIDGIRVCYHDDSDGCACRKPKPGLLIGAGEEFGLSLKECFMVGDRWRDIEAGATAGCRTVLIDRGYGERLTSVPDRVAADLTDAVDWILGDRSRVREPSDGGVP